MDGRSSGRNSWRPVKDYEGNQKIIKLGEAVDEDVASTRGFKMLTKGKRFYHLGKKIARHVLACKSSKEHANLKNYMSFIN